MMVLSFFIFAILALSTVVDSANIVVGDDPTKFNMDWADGVCYVPVKNVRAGDTIEFRFFRHDLYKMNSLEAYSSCSFAPEDAELLASFGQSPYTYTVTPEDAMPPPPLGTTDNVDAVSRPSFRSLYFSCSIGSHCYGKQRLRVDVDIDYSIGNSSSVSAFRSANIETPLPEREEDPVSMFVMGADNDSCNRVQNGENATILDRFMQSSCEDPVQEVDDYGREVWFRSCLSPPMTLTPGGVVNEATIVHFPFPTDHRVALGRRKWEFVQGSDLENLEPVPVNQLYIHHILGGVVMGAGAESINRVDEDAPYPPPYVRLTGDFDDVMTFHIIDLRETGDNWLECLECRCRGGDGSFLNIGGSGSEGGTTGGISCCTNCTDLTTPTVDYRMRYNVTWFEIDDTEPVIPVVGTTIDMARAVGEVFEWDVPQYEDMPSSQQDPEDPKIQMLVREGPANEIFGESFFDSGRAEFDEFVLHRCTAHMHIGALEGLVIDAETGEVLCRHDVKYGIDSATNEDFVTVISVTNFDPPRPLSANTRVRVETHYNATILHTGVMGLLTLFVSDRNAFELRSTDTALTVDLCERPTCNRAMFPSIDDIDTCEDNLESSWFCTAWGWCSCEELMMTPYAVGGCGGVIDLGRRNVSMNDYCALHCGCNQTEEEVYNVLYEKAGRAMTRAYNDVCTYATGNCQSYLSNMYTCGAHNDSDVHPVLRDIMEFDDQGSRFALERAKLGNERLRRFQEVDSNENVFVCSPEVAEEMNALDVAWDSTWASPLSVSAASMISNEMEANDETDENDDHDSHDHHDDHDDHDHEDHEDHDNHDDHEDDEDHEDHDHDSHDDHEGHDDHDHDHDDHDSHGSHSSHASHDSHDDHDGHDHDEEMENAVDMATAADSSAGGLGVSGGIAVAMTSLFAALAAW